LKEQPANRRSKKNPAAEMDARQAVRLRRFRMGVASYAMWVLLAFLAWAAGMLRLPDAVLAGALGGIVVTNLFFWYMLRSGRSLLWNDPSMTLAQVTMGLVWVMVLMAASPADRSLIMNAYFIVVLFGIFRLDRADFLRITGVALLGYVAVVASDMFFWGGIIEPLEEALRFLVLAASLVWCTFFGSHVAELRQKLRGRNEELQVAASDAQRLAERDHLTWAYNRRYIMNLLTSERARSERRHAPFSIVIFDLDHFKAVNDRFGHLFGDRVLTRFADLARRELRAMDVVASGRRGHAFGRYGGEEFIAVLPETGLEGARLCAERLRSALAKEVFEGNLKVTVSAGLAVHRFGETVEETLRRADDALYRAKKDGRNQVTEEKPLRKPKGGRTTAVVTIDEARRTSGA
jgi:diguanylate cyclase (GGDEF)-like protein